MTTSSVKYATHADSGGHWYCPATRQQIAEVVGANGKPRKPTLRDAREHGWLPGVTSIIRCAAAPGLERWKIGQAILAALTLPRDAKEPEDAWIDRIVEDGQETARKAAEAGTAIHAAVQQFFEGHMSGDALSPHLPGVLACLERVCGPDVKWTPERLCFHKSYATKADIASECGSWLLDLKTTDADAAKLSEIKTYPTHWMQLAATREALATDDDRFYTARCGILYVSRSHPGLATLVEVKDRELDKGAGMFRALLDYWRIDRGFTPGETQ